MSKHKRELTNRLEELFSTPAEPEASRPEPGEQAVPGKAGPVDHHLFEQTEASFVKAILEQLPLPVYVKDQDHKWVAVNPAFCRLIGKPADAVIGYTDKEQSDDDWQRDDQVFETGQADEMQQTLNQPDGSPFVRSIRRVPLKNADGNVDYLVTIIEDTAQINAAQITAAQITAAQITATQPAVAQPADAAERTAELARATQALQQSESFYHSLVEVMPQCICCKDLEGRFTFANRLFCEDIGRPLEDLIGKTDYDLHPPEMAEKYRRDDQRVVDTGQVFETVEERAVPGGDKAYVQTVKSPIRNAEGNIIGVQIMSWDVTERQRAEETLQRLRDELERHVQERTAELAKTNVALEAELTARQQAETAMRESELRLNTAFDYSANGIALVSTDGAFMRVNRAWHELLGYTEAEMLQLKFRDITHPDDIESSLQYLHKALAGEIDSFQDEKRYLHKNGQVIWIHLSTATVRDSRGNALYFISQINDITGRKEAEERILRRNMELAAINRLSHELTSLTEPAKIVELMYTTIGELIENRNLYIALYDEPNQQISFPLYTIDGERRNVSRRPVANGMTEYLLRTKAPLLIQHDVEAVGLKLGIDSIGREAQCWLGVPLLSGDKAIGVITLQDYDRADVYSAEHVELLTTIAAQAAIALENARLFTESRESYQRTQAALNNAQALYRTSRAIGEGTSPEAISKALMDYAATTDIDAARVLFFEHDEQGQPAFIVMREGWSADHRPAQPYNTRLPMADYPLASLMSREQPIVVDNVETDPRLNDPTRMLIVQLSGLRSAALVPLAVGDRWIGTLFVGRNNPSTYSEDLIRGYWTLAGQAAAALENIRLFNVARTHADELAVLNELGQALNARLDVDQVLAQVYTGLSRLIDTTNFYIALYDPATHTVSFPVKATESVIDQEITTISADQGLTGYILRTRTSLLLKDDASQWQKQMGMESVGQAAMSWLGVPMLVGGQIIGVMAIQNYETPNVYDEHDRDLLVTFANQTANAIQNARLFERTQRTVKYEQTLRQITARIRSSNDPDTIVRTAIRELGTTLGRQTFIRLGDAQQLSRPAAPTTEIVTSGDGRGSEGGQ